MARGEQTFVEVFVGDGRGCADFDARRVRRRGDTGRLPNVSKEPDGGLSSPALLRGWDDFGSEAWLRFEEMALVSVPPLNSGSGTVPVLARAVATDIYFSADVETDGPIPGVYSMLAIGIAVAGTFDGAVFRRASEKHTFYRELRPISEEFEPEALAVNRLDRGRLLAEGADPRDVMREASEWIAEQSRGFSPVLVAFPLSFDWSWLYWYFVRFAGASPFHHSRCFDVKTAYAVKAGLPITGAGRAKMSQDLRPNTLHSHNALEDALEQAEIFARVFEWEGDRDHRRK